MAKFSIALFVFLEAKRGLSLNNSPPSRKDEWKHPDPWNEKLNDLPLTILSLLPSKK